MKKSILLFLLLIVFFINAFAQENSGKVSEVGLVFSNFNSFGLRYKRGNEKTLFRITALTINGSDMDASTSAFSNNGVPVSSPSNPSGNFGLGLNIGFEMRKEMSEKLFFFYGFDLINSFTQSNNNSVSPNTNQFNYTDTNNVQRHVSTVLYNTNSSSNLTFNSGIGIVAGIGYKINNYFSIAAELIPTIGYRYTKTTSESTYNDVQWTGNNITGYTPIITVYNNLNQTTISKGITYGLANTGASITLALKIR